MATFTPQPEDKLNQGGGYTVLPPGQYDFEVTKAEDTQSSKGNDMIKLTLAVFDKGTKVTVWDYLTFTDKSQWKAYGFCKAVGLVTEFKAGELGAFHCGGRTGELRLAVEKGGDDQDDRNVVKGYIAKEDAAKNKPDDDGDAIPF